jgi:hypothetical protein
VNLAWLYVGLVYAAAVALARRAGVELPRRIALLFYLLVLLFLWKPLTGPYVNVAPDVLLLIPPWSASAPAGFDKFDVSNYELQDIVFQFIPWTQQVHASWRALKPPLWNPLAASGMPLLPNMQGGAMSPLRLLTIGLPLPFSFHAEAALKILVALTFAFLFCRRRYDSLPSATGAIAFGFGTFITMWLHFPHPNVAAFLPAVLYQIDLLAERRTRGRFLFAAILGPVLLFGGHPESTAHVVFFAALYALWVIVSERQWRLTGTLVAVSVVSLLLAAPVLLPFAEILPHSTSYAHAREQPHARATAFSDFHSLALLVHPRIYGERPGPLWGNAVTETAAGFAGLLGIGAFFGMLARGRFREREGFFVLATILTFAVVADVPYLSAPVKQLFSIALNSRFRLLLAFCLAVQTAALLHERRRPQLVAAIAGAAGVLVHVMVKTPFPTSEAKQFALYAAIPSIVVLALAATMLLRPFSLERRALSPSSWWYRAESPVLQGGRQLALLLAVFAELWAAGHGWHPPKRQPEIYPRTPILDALREQHGDQPYRFVGIGPVLFPNTHAPFGFEDVRVKDALSSAKYVDLLVRNVKGFDIRSYYMKWEDTETPLLDRLNVRWLMTEPKVELTDRARYRLIYDGYDGRIYENLRVKPRFFAEAARVQVARYTGDAYELRVDATRETLVSSSVGFWPGWRITHNGRGLEPRVVDEAFVGFTIPAGRGVVRMRYVPLSFWLGAAISLATLLAVVLLYHPRRCSTRAGST